MNRKYEGRDIYEIDSSVKSQTLQTFGNTGQDLKIHFESIEPSCPSDTNTPLNGSPVNFKKYYSSQNTGVNGQSPGLKSRNNRPDKIMVAPPLQ